MPPEPVPWDRKDSVFKDQKHDRIASVDSHGSGNLGGGGNSTPRWRDPYYSHRASPRRPPPTPSHHRQSVSYIELYDEPDWQGGTPSRSDEGFRSSNGWYSGGGRSSGREGRRSFRRSPYYDSHETGHGPSLRSVATPITSPSPHHLPLKDLHVRNDGSGDDKRSGRDRDHERDQERDCGRDRDHSLGSIDWKPLKWSRHGSLSSSKAVRPEGEEAGNGPVETSVLNLGKETPFMSPVSSPLPSDDGVMKKKPRLTWGQGLAKYEKQKVEGSSANSGKDQVCETSPKVMMMAGSTSPVTPCSAARSSSPGMEDRPFTNINVDAHHISETSCLGYRTYSEELAAVDNLLSISSLSSLLDDLLIPEDACFGDSTSNRSTTAVKLVSIKADITKELERTECEIELLENELKSRNNNGESVICQISLRSQISSSSEPSQELVNVSSKLSSTTATAVREPVPQICLLDEHEVEVKHANNDLSCTASSDNGKSASSGNAGEVPLDVGDVGENVAGNVSGGANNLGAACSSADAKLVVTPCEKAETNFVALILASNRLSAKIASQMLDEALPVSSQQINIWASDIISSCRKNDMRVREKIALQKRQFKFKERVLALKYRVFHRLWKEDLRLLSLRKHLARSHKRSDLCIRTSQGSLQKHRSSMRSRFTLPAGNSTTLVPSADVLEFTNKLLLDSEIKLFRNKLKMPALILDDKERRYSRFITHNNLIEDPPSFEKEISMINPWTQEERRVFMEMLATFGKDFAKISSFLSHKTTADCVEFYYKNHKSESFIDVKKRLDLRKERRGLLSNTYLVPTSGKKWNREANAASLDMLGAVSAVAARNISNTRSQQKYAAGSVLSSFRSSKLSRGSSTFLAQLSNFEIYGHERETTAAEMLASMSGALLSEAVSSCSISRSKKKNHVRMDRFSTPDVTRTIEEEDTLSDEGCEKINPVDWTDDEKSMFIRALSMHGKDFARISDYVRTKSREQCKIFFSKARKCMGLDQIQSGAGDVSTPMSDANGGRSEADDACAAEMNSAICIAQSCPKTDMNFSQSTFMESAIEAGDGSTPMGDANAGRIEMDDACAVDMNSPTCIGQSCSKIDVNFSQSASMENAIEACIPVGNTPLLTEIDRSDEQHDVGVSRSEEVDGKVDRDESPPKAEKVGTERENLQSDKSWNEMADVLSENNEHGPASDTAELSADVVLNTLETGLSTSPEHVNSPSIKCRELKSQTPAELQQGVISERISAADLKNDIGLHQGVALDGGSGDRQQGKMESGNTNNPEFSFAAEYNANGSASCTAPKFDSCANPTSKFDISHQNGAPVEFSLSQKRSRLISSMQDSGYPVPLGTSLADPSSTSSEGSHLAPVFNLQDHLHKLHQVLNQNESKTETNAVHAGHAKGSVSSQLDRCVVPDTYYGKVDGPVASSSGPGLLFPQRNEDTSDSQLRPCSTNSYPETDEQSAQQTGDVKLFGQILTNAQKSISSSQANGSRPGAPKHKKPAIHSETSSSRKDDSSIFLPRVESVGQSGLGEPPLRSYGFWDGNRIQTGFSSLPESSFTLSYNASAAPMPFYSVKDGVVSSSNGVLTSLQQAYVPPTSANRKRLESFSDLKKRNGFESVSGYHQGGRTAIARLDGNKATGNHGILVEAAGLSDPVAALKIAKLYKGEVESWMRDLNGR